MNRISYDLGFRRPSLTNRLLFTLCTNSLAVAESTRVFKITISLSTTFCGNTVVSDNDYHFYSKEDLFVNYPLWTHAPNSESSADKVHEDPFKQIEDKIPLFS